MRPGLDLEYAERYDADNTHADTVRAEDLLGSAIPWLLEALELRMSLSERAQPHVRGLFGTDVMVGESEGLYEPVPTDGESSAETARATERIETPEGKPFVGI